MTAYNFFVASKESTKNLQLLKEPHPLLGTWTFIHTEEKKQEFSLMGLHGKRIIFPLNGSYIKDVITFKSMNMYAYTVKVSTHFKISESI